MSVLSLAMKLIFTMFVAWQHVISLSPYPLVECFEILAKNLHVWLLKRATPSCVK